MSNQSYNCTTISRKIMAEVILRRTRCFSWCEGSTTCIHGQITLLMQRLFAQHIVVTAKMCSQRYYVHNKIEVTAALRSRQRSDHDRIAPMLRLSSCKFMVATKLYSLMETLLSMEKYDLACPILLVLYLD